MADMSEVLGLILGGGAGAGLYPLTKERAEPAVPLAGRYRLIDIPMSNCFHAGIEKIAILTQFNSASLHRHVFRTYTRDIFSSGWVQILAAEQTPGGEEWYRGTADAVRKQALEIREACTRYTLILAADQLYRMNYRRFLEFHEANQADVTIAVHPVTGERASSFGILELGQDKEIVSFVEKPEAEVLQGLERLDDPRKPYMASMGVYIFDTDLLFRLLEEAPGDDFGRDIVPAALASQQRVMGYVFDDYWEDIGTIRRFLEVNLELASPMPPFNLYSRKHPIYTRPRFLPGSQVQDCQLENVLVADGSRLDGSSISSAVIGLRGTVQRGSRIQRSIVMGADYYETEADRVENRRLGRPDMGIGPECVIEGAIIDKNARIGRRVVIRDLPGRPDEERESWVVRDGIVIVPKNGVIGDDTVI